MQKLEGVIDSYSPNGKLGRAYAFFAVRGGNLRFQVEILREMNDIICEYVDSFGREVFEVVEVKMTEEDEIKNFRLLYDSIREDPLWMEDKLANAANVITQFVW